MIIVYKLIHNLMGITFSEKGLAISHNNTRGGLRLCRSRATGLFWRHGDPNLEWEKPGMYCQRILSARLL